MTERRIPLSVFEKSRSYLTISARLQTFFPAIVLGFPLSKLFPVVPMVSATIKDAHGLVLTMPRNPELPPADLVESWLTDTAKHRAASFASLKRRADYLWVRLMLRYLLRRFFEYGAILKERPPFSPLIVGRDGDLITPLYATISHTGTFVGVGIASCPIAIDLEVISKDRPVEDLYKRLYGEDQFARVADDPVNAFYRAWGMNECAVKLPGVFVTDQGPLRVTNRDGTAAHTEHQTVGDDTLMTIVTEHHAEIGCLETTWEDVAASLAGMNPEE